MLLDETHLNTNQKVTKNLKIVKRFSDLLLFITDFIVETKNLAGTSWIPRLLWVGVQAVNVRFLPVKSTPAFDVHRDKKKQSPYCRIFFLFIHGQNKKNFYSYTYYYDAKFGLVIANLK